ncbi:MAG: nitroreductase family deazaflavin-dependent oxidoreductase [Pseudomonadales bacterium]|nr:nitroreductase family deazaflavin-dependent oxidoreductase [Pseudomonadales bacterium]
MSDDNSTNNPEDILGFMKDHIKRYLASDGTDGHDMNGNPCLVITTVGKKSGEPRQAAVIYGKEGDKVVVIASKGGSDIAPSWYTNMAALGGAIIQIGADRMAVSMRVADGEERQRLWKMMAGIFPAYDEYQKKTSRVIPVVVLEKV